MSKSPKLSRETKLHEECYTIAPLYEHSFLNKKKEFDLKLMLVYCSQKGIKPPTETITDFDTLHAKAKQTIVYININILNEKKNKVFKEAKGPKGPKASSPNKSASPKKAKQVNKTSKLLKLTD
jgi:hypothetical protein